MSDPFRADAAVVYRALRDNGPARAVDLASSCFPVVSEGPASSVRALGKRSLRRVLDSVVWMRHQGVTLSVIPDVDGSVFHLGAVAASVLAPRVTVFEEGRVRTESLVTAKVSQPRGPKAEPSVSEAMDVWHGRK